MDMRVTEASRRAIELSRVLIAGTVRDCAATLSQSIDAIRAATAGFAKIDFFLIESDSDDETVDILTKLSERNDFHFTSLGKLRDRIGARTERIAHCRNQIVDEVIQRRTDYDYILLADFDGPNCSLDRRSIEDCWRHAEDWSVITANQAGPYYDIWALRHAHWCPGDCWQSARELEPVFGRSIAREIAVYSRQKPLPLSGPLLPVDSAFGGLAIYTTEAFCSGRYVGMDGQTEVCEHVAFHRDIKAAGHRIFINPALINEGPLEHRTPQPLARRIASRMRSWLR